MKLFSGDSSAHSPFIAKGGGGETKTLNFKPFRSLDFKLTNVK